MRSGPQPVQFYTQPTQGELGSLFPTTTDQGTSSWLLLRITAKITKFSARITSKITVQDTEVMSEHRTSKLSSGAGWSALTPMTMGNEAKERRGFFFKVVPCNQDVGPRFLNPLAQGIT